MTEEEEEAKRIHPASIWVPVMLIVLGLVVFYNYLMTTQQQQKEQRLPYLTRLEKSEDFVESSGKQVSTAELKGKVMVVGHVFTRCVRGCAGLVALLEGVRDGFAEDAEHVHFVNVSVDPEHDTAEVLQDFRENHGLKGENWWFLTGEKETVRKYMMNEFGFHATQEVPEEQRLEEGDVFLHDMRVCLVDHQGHVRGFYQIMSPEPEQAGFYMEKLEKDLKFLLEEKKKG